MGNFLALGLRSMPDASYRKRTRRCLYLIMTQQDDEALSELLRRHFSPIEIIEVDFGKKELLVRESLAQSNIGKELYITNPDPGELSLDRLRTSLLFCDEVRKQVFHDTLPRRFALYQPSHYIATFTSKLDESGVPVEVLDQAYLHFMYDRDNAEAHRFANKIWRLLSKELASTFALVDAETGTFLKEWGPVSMLRAGQDALETCRQHPHRYLAVAGPMKDAETRLFYAPLSRERYEELKLQKRRAKRQHLT